MIHPLVYAKCFVANSKPLWFEKTCNFNGSNIIGVSKLLAYGDFLKGRAIQRNKPLFEVLDEEVDKYPYSRKAETKVCRKILQFLSFDIYIIYCRFPILLQLISMKESILRLC